RDARGATRALELSDPIFAHAWQNRVALAAAETAHGLLSEGRTLEQAVALGASAMSAVSSLAEQSSREAGSPDLACGRGCTHCCHQSVGISALEAMTIYDHLRRRL